MFIQVAWHLGSECSMLPHSGLNTLLALENEQTGLYEKMCAMNGVKDNDILSSPVASSEGYHFEIGTGQ